jgi:hypothetical protein
MAQINDIIATRREELLQKLAENGPGEDSESSPSPSESDRFAKRFSSRNMCSCQFMFARMMQ